MADMLQIRYPASGVEAELAITDATIKAPDLRQFRIGDEPLATFDPGFMNTAVCRSSITYIDGEAGILEYRGYPIAELAEKSTYLEVAYLLLHGELPNPAQLSAWELSVTEHRMLPDKLKTVLAGFPYDAHPMTILMASVAAFYSFYPDARNFEDPAARDLNITRLIAKMPTLAAFAYRKGKARPYVNPDDKYGYCHNFLAMLFKQNERRYVADPRLVRAMEVLFILHADHEQNCSTNAVRVRGQLRQRPVHLRVRRHRRAARTAARRRQRGGAEDAARDRQRRPRPRVHRRREGRQGAHDGLRPPRLQEL